MHRFLERLDSAAATVVPLLYLVGLMLGTMAYFTGVTLDAGLAVGMALACAAEVHAFLEQRRTRAAWGVLQRTPDDDPRRDSLSANLRLHVGILAALVVFSTYNSIAFVAATWHPIPGWLPGWLQIGIRGSVVPSLFLLTGALAPLSEDAGGMLARAAHDMLQRTLKATVKQWRRRVDRAYHGGLDLAPVAVSLFLDAGDTDGARRVQLIADGLNRAEGKNAPERPPTGPGTPAIAAPGRDSDGRSDEATPAVVRFPASDIRRARAARTHRAKAKRERQLEQVRAWLREEGDVSRNELARRLRCSPSHAGALKRDAIAAATQSRRMAQ